MLNIRKNCASKAGKDNVPAAIGSVDFLAFFCGVQSDD
jgi:hypothetical protein